MLVAAGSSVSHPTEPRWPCLPCYTLLETTFTGVKNERILFEVPRLRKSSIAEIAARFYNRERGKPQSARWASIVGECTDKRPERNRIVAKQIAQTGSATFFYQRLQRLHQCERKQ